MADNPFTDREQRLAWEKGYREHRVCPYFDAALRTAYIRGEQAWRMESEIRKAERYKQYREGRSHG